MTGSSRLTAIVCADAVGFGARAAADEEDAHRALAEGHTTLRQVFEAHGGRVINTWGDGVIAEFGAIGEAVRAAVEFQDAHDGRPGALRFRVGINLADVMHEHDDLFGHGVNVAARLQQAAAPGGILISDAVHAVVSDRVVVGFQRIAPVAGKAHEPTIPAWRVATRDNTPPERPADPPPAGAGTAPRPEADQPPSSFAPLVAFWDRLTPYERRSVALIGFLAAINLLSGTSYPWFLWPALPIAFLMVLRRITYGGRRPRRRHRLFRDDDHGDRHHREAGPDLDR